MLQMISRACQVQTPALTALQYALAIDNMKCVLADSPYKMPDLEDEQIVTSMLAGKLRSRCCGLIEIQDRGARGYYSEPRASFLHRTVYDYLQNHFVSEKLYSICKIESGDMDHSFLTASAFLVEHSAIDPQAMMHLSECLSAPAADYLSACIQYAEMMNEAGDAQYLKQLRTADEYLRDQCDPYSGHTATHERLVRGYTNAWKEAMSRPDLAEKCSLTLVADTAEPVLTSLFAASQLGLAEYMEWQISFSSATRENVLLVSIRLLRMMIETGTGSARLKNCVQAIRLILSIVTKSTTASSFSDQLSRLWTEWLLMHHRIAGWLGPDDHVTTDTLAVTLSLLEAAPQVKLREELAVVSREELTHNLIAQLDDTTNAETHSLITNILHRLGHISGSKESVEVATETFEQEIHHSAKAYMGSDLMPQSFCKQSSHALLRKDSRCIAATSSPSISSTDAAGTFSSSSGQKGQVMTTLKRLRL